MSREQRQGDELRELCCSGAVGRAIDLAFEHFARFGLDVDLLGRLGAAVERPGVPERVRRRFTELCEAMR